jgi:hypothetical protein
MRSATRRDVFLQPLDAALLALRVAELPYQWTDDLKVWRSVCPSCRAPEWGLTIREGYHGGPITLRCSSRCSDHEIRAALEAAAHDVDPFALAIAEDARDVAERALDLRAAQVIDNNTLAVAA